MSPGLRFQITDHAVQRFQERVRPGLGFLDAKREFSRLLRTFGELSARPSWMSVHSQMREPEAWVAITPELVAACEVLGDGGLRVLTAITNGSLSPASRRKRTASKHRAVYA